MEAKETISCRGHPLVRGTHPTTFEVTKEDHLTPAGDCIIGIAADKGAADLSTDFREALARDGTRLVTRLTCGGITVEVHSEGSANMTLDHPIDLVWRRSGFVCGRTIGIHSDFVAATLPRELIAALARGEEMILEMRAFSPC
jgi:hypothetical protein